MKKLFLVLCLALLVGCATNPSSGPQNFSAQPPEQWHQVNTPKFYILTKDGPYSQYILVQQRPVDKPFSNTSRKLAKGMSPKDAAAVFLEEISNDAEVFNFRLVENQMSRVNQHEAFKLVFTYEDKDGRHFQTYMFGLLNGNWFYSLRYNADRSMYCNQDIDEFHRFVKSFKVNEA